MYFYIKDDATQTERTYTKVMKLKDELIKQGIQAQFSSKDDALKFLEQRLPEVLNNLKQYNIDNPLPATLYVAVSTEQEYQQLKQTILEYRSIITNVEDLDKAKTLKAQEQRIIKTIGIANGVVVFSYLLILMLFVIMVSVVIGLVRQYVYKHRRLIEVKKLLG
jgi:cell division protein FtsX